ncbi:MAG: hypothetical protein QOH76_1530 [Thermoleophilaceae bacterium]|nr:hypothetical protein [Thermoleophilaceae bacterium]
MNAYLLIVGAALLLIAPLLVRYRGPLARWSIATRVETLRRTSLMNTEYVEREVDALRRPGSRQLSRVLVVVLAIFLAAMGVYAILKGLELV